MGVEILLDRGCFKRLAEVEALAFVAFHRLNSANCSAVSIPSATSDMPRFLASMTMAWTMAA